MATSTHRAIVSFLSCHLFFLNDVSYLEDVELFGYSIFLQALQRFADVSQRNGR